MVPVLLNAKADTMVMEKQRKIEANPFWGGGFFFPASKN